MLRGEGPSPSLVYQLIAGLPEESLTTALMRGGREHYGWTTMTHILANIYDALNVNTRATGMFKKKPPEIPLHWRPKTKKQKKKSDEPVTVASVYKLFQRR